MSKSKENTVKPYTRLASLFQRTVVNPSVALGIEVEVEFDDAKLEELHRGSMPSSMGWERTGDGSLRGTACEYLTRPSDLKKALTLVSSLFDRIGPVAKGDSPRTSIHVHVNQTHKDMRQVCNMMMAYYLLEAHLFEHVAPGRDTNLYCPPVTASSVNMNAFVTFLKRINSLNGQKYTALNYNPLKSYGTLEFRMYPGKYKKAPIRTWVAFLANMSEMTMAEDLTPSKLYDMMWDGDIKGVLDAIMTDTCPYRKRIMKGFDRSRVPFKELIAFAHAVDWDEVEYALPEPKKDLLNKYGIGPAEASLI